MRELMDVARWRRETRGRRPIHPTHVGFWPLVAKLRMARPPRSSNGAFTAVLLVHKRPANIDLQIRAALHAEHVGDVVVSCNNPDVQLDKWINVVSPRVRVLREGLTRNQTRRYDVALGTDGERFVLPDDDVLMLPESVDRFCAALPADGSRPVGLAGQRLLASGAWDLDVSDDGAEVDVLNRAYVCTREHAQGVFENAELLGWSESERFTNPADDVLLSFAGRQNPTIAHVDHVNCVSHYDVKISTYRQAEFHELRSDWVNRLRALRHREPARRDLVMGGTIEQPRGLTRRVNVAAQPLRARYYRGRYIRPLSLLPGFARRSLGLDDSKSMRTRRLQVGTTPFLLEGFLHVGDRSVPNVTLDALPSGFATEIVALGDDATPRNGAVATWHKALLPGGRAIVGVRSEAEADALRDAMSASGFEVVAVIPRGHALESDARVSPWSVEIKGEPRGLPPVPAVVETAADLFVIARAR